MIILSLPGYANIFTRAPGFIYVTYTCGFTKLLHFLFSSLDFNWVTWTKEIQNLSKLTIQWLMIALLRKKPFFFHFVKWLNINLLKEWWKNVFEAHNECGSLQPVGDNLISEIDFFFLRRSTNLPQWSGKKLPQ